MTSAQMKTILQISKTHNLSTDDLVRALNALKEVAQLPDTDNSPKAKRLRRSAVEVTSKLGASVLNALKGCLRSF